MKKMSWMVLGLSSSLLLATSACSTSGPSSSLDGEAAQKIYTAEIAKLDFPPGQAKPTGSPIIKPGQSYDPGVAESEAGEQYLCAWQKYLIAHAKDKGAQTAFQRLDAFKQMSDYTKSYDANSREVFDKGLAAAKLGDLTNFRQSVDANCAP